MNNLNKNLNISANLDTSETEDDRVHILDYMELSKKERTAHIDFSSECIPAILETMYVTSKSEFKSPQYARLETAKALENYLGVKDKIGSGNYVHTCHACMNDSTAPNGFVCVNPKHLYFGTPKENCEDKPFWNKRKGGLASWSNLTPQQRIERKKKMSASVKNFYYNTKEGKKVREKQSKTSTANMERQLAAGNHISQKVHTCEHCGKSSRGRIFFRWHGKACKHNPENSNKAKQDKLNNV